MTSREWNSIEEGERDTIGAHQDDVPVKLAAIGRALGLTIKAATLPAGISGEIRPDQERPGRFIIRVNRHDPSSRQRFTVAHEIGHYLLHRDQIANGITDDVLYRSSLSDQREAQANRIAADILMPEDQLSSAIARAQNIGVNSSQMAAYLAEQFEVSEAAMKIRLGI